MHTLTEAEVDRILGNRYESRRDRDRRLLYVDSYYMYYWRSDKLAEVIQAVLRAAGLPITAVNSYAVAGSILGHEVSNSIPRELSMTINK